MEQTHTKPEQTPPRPRAMGWKVPLGSGAAVICAVGLWGHFGGGANGPAIAATVLAAAVLALTLVLAVTVKPRTR